MTCQNCESDRAESVDLEFQDGKAVCPMCGHTEEIDYDWSPDDEYALADL